MSEILNIALPKSHNFNLNDNVRVLIARLRYAVSFLDLWIVILSDVSPSTRPKITENATTTATERREMS